MPCRAEERKIGVRKTTSDKGVVIQAKMVVGRVKVVVPMGQVSEMFRI